MTSIKNIREYTKALRNNADLLYEALCNTIDTLLENYDNGQWCPACGGEYNDSVENMEKLLWCDHDSECTLEKAVTLRNRMREIEQGTVTV